MISLELYKLTPVSLSLPPWQAVFARTGRKGKRFSTEFDWKVEMMSLLRRHFSGKQNR